MKRILLSGLPEGVPVRLWERWNGAPVYDSSCSPEARVYFIDRDGGYYLKTAAAGSLGREAAMTDYYYRKGLGTEVLSYDTEGDRDWLLTRRMVGEDATHGQYLSDPKRLCDVMGTALRSLHEIDATDCPIPNRTADYLALAEENFRTGRYDKTAFPDSFGYASAEGAWRTLCEGRDALCGRVLLHGDYCLPNIMLDGWRLSGFIDLGNGGVGDPHIDLFWGAWTLWFNLKTDRYRDRFFDAYGRDAVDEVRLRTVAAAEVFG
ncbi:MAG: aminoglycoside 3'-phosphotransferase [Clostridia bacterium]|nr:aminoglycoside 3'-phosphotransferase [Clostridia bacterium]